MARRSGSPPTAVVHKPPPLGPIRNLTVKLAEVGCSTGRNYLSVAGIVVAMEGDKCRDSEIPERVLPSIPEDELEKGSIGGKPIKDMPRNVVRFFRGDNWTEEMLRWAADQINAKAQR